jgi:hypothetical protein
LHTPEQQGVAASVHASPLARQAARPIRHWFWSHRFEQQSAFSVHACPAILHKAPPHTPALHAREQHAWEAEHWAPSGKQ